MSNPQKKPNIEVLLGLDGIEPPNPRQGIPSNITITRFLTQQQVNGLPVGTVVGVKWPDGRGPARLTIKGKIKGQSYVDNRFLDLLDTVGEGPSLLRIWIWRG